MGIFEHKETAIDRFLEEGLFKQAADEFKKGEIVEGLWIKAKALCNGDENKAESQYILLRVQSLKDADELSSQMADEDSRLRNNARKSITKKMCKDILKSKGYTLTKEILGPYTIEEKRKFSNREFAKFNDLLSVYEWAIGADDLLR